MHMSTSINFVTNHKDILFIAEVRGDGSNTIGYNSTSAEFNSADMFIVRLGVISVVSILVCLTTGVVIFYTCKETFFNTF